MISRLPNENNHRPINVAMIESLSGTSLSGGEAESHVSWDLAEGSRGFFTNLSSLLEDCEL